MRCYCLHHCVSGVSVLESDRRTFIAQINKYAEKIIWKSNSTATSLTDMKQAALQGQDAGFDSLTAFFDADCYHDWIILAQIATCLYNRDHAGNGLQLLCVIRMDKYLMLSQIVYFRGPFSVYYPVAVRDFAVHLPMSRGSNECHNCGRTSFSGID